MKLAELQHDFCAWLIHASTEASLRLDHEQRGGLAVYQNNYRTQLVGCLEASYPLLSAWMGSQRFREAAITHIDNHPPHTWTLDAYGVDFEETLRAMFPHNPDLHELAWVEWSLSESFVAADAGAVSNSLLPSVDWDHARLHLAPSLRLRVASTNAEALWSALHQRGEASDSHMLDEPGGLVTWRREFTCRLQQIDAIEYAALLLLRDENRFATLCDALVEQLGEEVGVQRAGVLLAGWIDAGIVTGITSDPAA